ncbi:hypothetical protein B0H67DRAFT_478490 [Lasiosphaeris hirsuta]|uniref:F-box domain-containing protein n=1 Tax=Lasiosphaeris hirsuta TaxID=260670 RepID=A0AA40ECF6_9PEZI|nr:hypothetical protein B0H67DRAFT_478490 [Lasiosphaeris hirsuta]
MVSLYPDRSSMPSDRPGSNMKPRRLSNSSSSSSTASSIVWGRESFESRLRSSSLSSSQTSIESMPPLKASRPSSSSSHIHHQMGGYSWSRPAPVKLRQRKARPGELFSLLPGEVLELILQELRQLHLRPGSGSCETCWMRDCCSVAVSARKFVKYAREALYQHVHLVGPDSPQMKKRLRMNYGGRLVLLRRTLRANTHIAVIVRSLKPPVLPPGAALVEYNDLVASVVRACPNLERLVGYYPVYTHEFQRLFHALSTRKRLKEMSWVVETSPMQRQQNHRPTSSHPLWAPGDLQPQQSQGFLDFHLGWQNLTTLVVHCQPEATITPDTLFSRAIRCLPSLQNLHLSHLPHTSFNDNSLLCLPPLKKLSLSHLPGITTSGISALATRVSSATITTLTLIHINVETLPALARLFAHLTSLETFSIVQCYAPIMPTDELVWLFPYLASHSLCKLHWDIPYLPTRATTADNILAKSISAGGFPALRVIRAPNDPEGIFQSLCRPRERIDSTIDRYRGGHDWHASGQTQGQTHGRSASGFVPSRPQSQSNSNTPPQTRPRSQSHSFFRSSSHTRNSSAATTPNAKSTGSPPTSPTHPPDAHALFLPRDNSDLHQARLAAQTRLEGARRFPRYFIQIVDEDGDVIEKHGVGAFIGNVRSNIHYVLTPEEGGTDEGGGLVGVAEMAGDCGEALVLGRKGDGEKERGRLRGKKEKVGEAMVDGESRTREGCQGRWNTSYGTQVVDKKDRERWAHTERGRWMGVALS